MFCELMIVNAGSHSSGFPNDLGVNRSSKPLPILRFLVLMWMMIIMMLLFIGSFMGIHHIYILNNIIVIFVIMSLSEFQILQKLGQ